MLACILPALLLCSRLVCALFSPRSAALVGRHPSGHIALGFLALGGILILVMLLSPAVGPPAFIERRGQRRELLTRVVKAGGWAAIQRDCDALVAQHQDGWFDWHRGMTNYLPPALAALRPWQVRFDSPRMLRRFRDATQVAVVRIKIFGAHSTGGHSTPYFGLEVVSGGGADSYRPSPSEGGVSGNRHSSYSSVTERIYEIY